MSKETVLPPEGPAGTVEGPGQEASPLLSAQHDAHESRKPRTDGQSHTTEENANHFKTLKDHFNSKSMPFQAAPGDSAKEQNGFHSSSPAKAFPNNVNGFHPGPPRVCTCGASVRDNSPAGAVPGTSAPMTTQPKRQLSTPVSDRVQRKLKSSLSVNSDSSRRSKGSSTGSQKPPLPEDCCVHCILACLFCEFLTLCNMMVAQASCGVCASEAGCCCCCNDDLGDDCNCPCDMDCGIMDACCESSDCLEICMECCGICFPT